MSSTNIVEIAVFCPLRKTFDYLVPSDVKSAKISPGKRVSLPFGKGQRTGIVLCSKSYSEFELNRLKPITSILDEKPLLPQPLLALLAWASDYYHHAPGEVYFSAMPAALRKKEQSGLRKQQVWKLTVSGRELKMEDLQRAPARRALIQYLQSCEVATPIELLLPLAATSRQVLKAMEKQGWVSCAYVESELAKPEKIESTTVNSWPLNEQQQHAADQIKASKSGFKVFLLQGITGSGKTEVYFSVIEHVLSLGKQVLVLVPEINLTPQLVNRFAQRFHQPVTVLHSALSDGEQVANWYHINKGLGRILIGTRLAVFTPFAELGLIVVDEEHDLSYKQQEGFRYHARDVAVKRGSLEQVPVILGSATPSLESLYNARHGRYELLRLSQRAGAGQVPEARLVDMRGEASGTIFSAPLLQAMKHHIHAGNQVLLFLNRRGYAPVLLCHACSWVAKCARCDMPYTWHRRDRRLRCHHCGGERPQPVACPDCQQEEFVPLGTGTQKVEEALEDCFPGVSRVRIDRDNTRRKGAMAALLDDLAGGQVQILVGTQMLAKGHDFPHLTLVGVLDGDQGLFSTDFRASERMAQLLLQVMGRAGRADKPGEVLIQTHQPEHPLLNILIFKGFDAFVSACLEERQQTALPPFSFQVLLRARAKSAELGRQFLQQAKEKSQPLPPDLMLLGPVPAPMERRGGDYRYQLLLQAESRKALHGFLRSWLPQVEGIKASRKVRWSLDVDPMDMY